MKRFYMVIVLLFTIVLSGCSLIGTAKATIALENMNQLTSYRMDISIAIDGDIINSSRAYVQDNYEQLHILDTQIDMFIEDDGTYIIDRSQGIPILMYSEEYSLEDDYDDFGVFMNVKFEKEDEYWVMSSEEELFEDISEIKLLLEDNYVKEMIFVGEMDGSDLEVYILYSHYDEIEIDEPVYITEDEFNAFVDELVEKQITLQVVTNGGFYVHAPSMWADCGTINENQCFFESGPPLIYTWGDDMYYAEDDEYDTFAAFDEAHPNSGVTSDLLDIINRFFEYRSME